MRRRVKYHLPNSRRSSSSSFLYWLVGLAVVIVAGWIWWERHPTPRPPAKPAAPPPAAQTPAPRPVAPLAPPRLVSVPAATTAAGFPRPAQNALEAQLALLGHGISCGSLDGVVGSQTRAALMVFQQAQHLPVSGGLDAATRAALLLDGPPYTAYAVTSNDLARLQPLAATWLGKSQQSALDYENILELVAEKFFAHPALIRRLNPGIDWTNVAPGTVLQAPNAAYPDPLAKAAFVYIHLAGKTLDAYDADTNLLAHFPCSIARLVEKRPVGELHVQSVAPNPNYTFDPDVFPESPEAREIGHKLILPPGPNNPVGVAWIGLDRPGYGIHGTPRPEDVGRTESHGCFRLANWNAQYLVRLVTVGTPVYVVE